MSQLEHSTNVTGSGEPSGGGAVLAGGARHQLDTGQLFQYNQSLMTLMFATLIHHMVTCLCEECEDWYSWSPLDCIAG